MEFDVQKSFGYPVLRTIVQGENSGKLSDYPRIDFPLQYQDQHMKRCEK